MEPDEVGTRYKYQADKILEFINYLNNTNNQTKDEYKIMLIAICQQYYELLMNLATYTPLLKAYKIKFFKINTLESKDEYSDPPFEKDYFNEDKPI